MTINENVMQYFLDACNNYSYGFVANTTNLENVDTDEKGSIIGYPLAVLPTKINQYWFECDTEKSVEKIFNLTLSEVGTKFRFEKFSNSFFEDVWLSCKTDAEKDYFFNSFARHIIKDIKFEELGSLRDGNYINKIIETQFTADFYYKASYEDTLSQCFNVFRNENLKLTEKNLKLICKNNKYSLRKLTTQKTLKDFVEQYMPDSIGVVKDYWKKIDSELAGEEFISENICRYFSVDKVQIYNLRTDQNADFVERRLKALNTFLNKSQNKKITKIERSVLDGSGEGQSHYRFFIISPESGLDLKRMINELVIQTIKLEDEPNIKSFQTMLNYSILQQQLQRDDYNEVMNIKKNKI